MANVLQNPSLAEARLAAAFYNNGPSGAIHVPIDWTYVYEARGAMQRVERLKPGEQPHWLTDRPPQVQPANQFERGTYIETTSYTGTGGFHQVVLVEAGQRYVARATVTVFVTANEPASDAVMLSMRIHHQDGIAASEDYYVSQEQFRQPFELLQPVIEPLDDGDIGFEFLATVRYPLVSVKVVVHHLYLSEVGQDYGNPVHIQPIHAPVVPAPTPEPPEPAPDPQPPVPEQPPGCLGRAVLLARRFTGRA